MSRDLEKFVEECKVKQKGNILISPKSTPQTILPEDKVLARCYGGKKDEAQNITVDPKLKPFIDKPNVMYVGKTREEVYKQLGIAFDQYHRAVGRNNNGEIADFQNFDDVLIDIREKQKKIQDTYNECLEVESAECLLITDLEAKQFLDTIKTVELAIVGDHNEKMNILTEFENEFPDNLAVKDLAMRLRQKESIKFLNRATDAIKIQQQLKKRISPEHI
jgi:predicted RNase H-like HicB family nuclease